jgi:hypothetical protein
MAKKTREKQFTPPRADAASPGGELAPWFEGQISRRTATQRVGTGLAIASLLGMAGVSVYQLMDDDPEVSLDSLELQRKEGWDVGSAGKQLSFPMAGSSATDSLGRADWSSFLDPNQLIAAYQPPSPAWQPFFVPTLIQSLAQPSLRAQIKPLRTPEMGEAYERAGGLRELIGQAENAGETLIVADLAGPASAALGAALSDTAQLVPVFDNWPHPLGVVPSQETLGALLYYAREVEEKKARLPQSAPALMLLDNRRLAPYRDEETQFDNRYLAKIPPADQLKSRGVTNLIYLVRDESQKEELDDLNEEFVELQKQGIGVRLLRLSDFKPYEETVAAAGAAAGAAPVQERHYYYGGSPLLHWWFFSHYLYRPYPNVVVVRGGRSVPVPGTLTRPASAPPFRPPAYRPVTRPTVFSGARVGGASGVGRVRPSGFGRTSVRMSGGRVNGTRTGRSGSYGRSWGGRLGG